MADPAELVSAPEEEVAYHPKDAIERVIEISLTTGAAGFFLSAVQNTLARSQVGAFGVFTRFGSTTAWAAGAGATYAFVSTATGNLRQKEDMWNHLWGGFATGALLGLRRRTFPAVIGTGLFAGATLGGLSYAGGQIYATGETPEERLARKEEHRRRFRRPYQEMVNEIGEGRGIYPPGYAERRAQRIKENYGIEVQPPYYERKKAAGIETSAL